MLSSCAALLLLACMGSMGVAVLRRTTDALDPLELFAYGAPAGVVASSLVLLGLACLCGLSPALVVVVAVLCAGVAITTSKVLPPRLSTRRNGVSLFAVVVLGSFALRWLVLSRGTLTIDDAGLWAGTINIWGDWAQHLGDVTSFAFGDNFPPTHPRLAGQPFAYHYLTSVTVAAMVELGMDPIEALPLHSLVFSVLLALGIYAFARRLTGNRAASALTVLLFLLGGGLGWSLTLGEMLRSHSVWDTLVHHPWDRAAQRAANYPWMNVYFALIHPQRSFLYGLPLNLLVLTLLIAVGRDPGRRRSFLVAGIVAGMLPFAHLGSLLALALITPTVLVLFPSRRLVLFFGIWTVIALPQIYVQQGGEPGAAGAIRLLPGWVSAGEPWLWFWIKNLGAFVPLLALALAERTLIARPARQLLWAFMPVFALANLLAFQPWGWDNTKVLAYWFLAVCILVSALLETIWRNHEAIAVRSLVVVLVVTMVLSGLLENLSQLLGRDRRLLLSREELRVAEAVRAATPPHAVFAVGLQHNHPVPVLAGRRVMMSYPGWMWSQGVDSKQRERDLRTILALASGATELMASYGVTHVVIGPNERERCGADLEAYRAHFPSVVRTESYEVFDVRSAPGPSTSNSKTRVGSRMHGG